MISVFRDHYSWNAHDQGLLLKKTILCDNDDHNGNGMSEEAYVMFGTRRKMLKFTPCLLVSLSYRYKSWS